MLNLVRSKANPSIIALLTQDELVDNTPAIKVTYSKEAKLAVTMGYSVAEAEPGCMFNYHSSRWQPCAFDDLEAQLEALDFLATHGLTAVLVVM